MSTTIALSGDAIVNRRLSACTEPEYEELLNIFRASDVGLTHLETVIHDFDAPETYPAAEAGGTWMRSPTYVADELAWAGFDVLTHASNHALDYGYGALRRTWAELDRAGLAHAGTGETLADARSAAYVDCAGGRVGVVSMTTSFTPWSQAGPRRPDMDGRPGVNPLRIEYTVDEATGDTIRTLAAELGQWVMPHGENGFAIHPPGLHNSLTCFRIGDVDRPERATHPDDREGNLSAIADASERADLLVAHNHTHAWDPLADIATPPPCIERFSRSCIEAGADVVLNQGSHAPLRGIEIHEGRPIFYDPGDLFLMNRSGIRLPMAFYRQFERHLETDPWDAKPSEAQAARPPGYGTATNPPNGYQGGSVPGFVIPRCSFAADGRLEAITLTPGELLEDPMGLQGMPVGVRGDRAKEILSFVKRRSRTYGTEMTIEDDRAHLAV